MNSRHGLEIRAATSTDAPGLADLLAAAGYPIPARTLATRVDSLRQSPGTILLALEWGPPSGVIVAAWFPTLGADRPTARITTLLVGPEQRRRGIARLLLKAASQAARAAGCTSIEIDTGGQQDLAEFCAATGFLPGTQTLVRSLRRQA